jgi:GMP synthase-like glutamine amidotransferase
MKQKKIKIAFADGRVDESYVDFLKIRFAVEVKDAHNDPGIFKDPIDLLVFTGGEDVSPKLYNQQKGMYTSTNENRDSLERHSFSVFENVPKLGICRGAQFLTVMNGGKLIQHVVNHGQSHPIIVDGWGEYLMTSTHHQMLFPFNLSEKEYQMIAYSKYFRSTVYLNGDNEEIDLPNNFLEPEIVYYDKSRSLCIQGHPEFSSAPEETKMMSLDLIEKYLISDRSKGSVIGRNELEFIDAQNQEGIGYKRYDEDGEEDPEGMYDHEGNYMGEED